MARYEDGNTASEAWSDATRPLARLVFPARHVSIAVIAAIIPFVASLGPHRWALSVLCLVAVLPLDLLMHRSTLRHDRFPAWMPFVNQCTATAVVAIEPRAFLPVIVLLLSDDTLTATVFGRRSSLPAGFLGVGLLSCVAVFRDIDAALAPLVALAICVVTTSTILGGLADSERTLRARYRTLVSEVDVIVWELVPGSDRFSYVSSCAEQLLGYPLADWYVPGFWTDHIHPEDRERVLDELDRALERGDDHVLEYRFVHADGHPVHLRDVAAVELDAGGRVVNMRGVMMDISDARRAEELLRERATHDVLTGLPNRGLLAERVDQALAASRATGAPVALLLLDLDDFKEVNDALGHHAGDRLLTAFADRLRTELADCDTIARLGGDEFAVLLTAGATEAAATAVGRRVLSALRAPFVVDGLELHTGASIGVALFPDHATDATDLQSRADMAMYLAKRGRHGVAVYEPGLDGSGVRRLTLLTQLRPALAGGGVRVDHRPWFDLGDGRVAAVEAVPRWDHADEGEVGATDLVALADLAGLGEQLTRHVVETGLAAVRGAGLDAAIVADVSARTLTAADFLPWLGRLVEQHRLRPGDLVLQLTGAALAATVEPAAVDAVRKLGVHVGLRGFGDGGSELAHLRRHRLDILALDAAFAGGRTTDAPDARDAADATICGAVVALAHELGLRVVADGATTAAARAELRRLGCDLVAGDAVGELADVVAPLRVS